MRLMLADDAVLFREGMARILTEAGFEVVGSVGNSEDLVNLVRVFPPDVVVLDLRMPPGFADEGLEAAGRIRQIAPQVGVMLLSQYVEVHHALRLMEDFSGSVGYLLKDRVSDLVKFAADIRRVANGDVVIDSELVTRLVLRGRERDPLAQLAPREREVLALMARGLSNSAMCAEMHLSLKTVEGYVRCIFAKLGLAPGERENRRVLAVLEFLRNQ